MPQCLSQSVSRSNHSEQQQQQQQQQRRRREIERERNRRREKKPEGETFLSPLFFSSSVCCCCCSASRPRFPLCCKNENYCPFFADFADREEREKIFFLTKGLLRNNEPTARTHTLVMRGRGRPTDRPTDGAILSIYPLDDE